VSLYDWLLFLHVLSAFAVVAAVVHFSIVIAAGWRRDVPSDVVSIFRLSRVGEILVGVGSVGVLVFGVWLAIEVDGYHPWDGWIIAAYVLWLLFGAIGNRAGKIYNAARDRARTLVSEGRDEPSPELAAMLRSGQGLATQVASIVIAALFLLDMLFKPGA
jgi:uncharacterized membrane protein